MKQRNQYLDIVRGSALILMVFGHCLQYGNGTEFIRSSGFFYNRLFQLIYSFHMPLFMLLSGYLFFFTARRYQKTLDFIKNRWQRICLPIIGWQTFHYLVTGSRMLIEREKLTLEFFLKYVRSWFTDIWFLTAILYCSLIVFCVRKYFKDSIILYFLGFIFTFVTPDFFVKLDLYKYMYPFFICGYLFGREWEKIRRMLSRSRMPYLFLGSLIGFLALFCFWEYDVYIYITGYTLLWRESVPRQLVIDLYRMVIGFMGSIVLVSGLWIVYDWKSKQKISALVWEIVSRIGQQSLCVYVLSSEMVHWFLEAYSDRYHFSYLGTLLETVVLIAVSYSVAVVINRIPVLNKILLGGK